LDCEIPETLPGWPDKVPLVQFLPLTLLRKKQPLIAFEVKDESGKTVLALPWEHKTWVAWSVLTVAAEALTGEPLSESLSSGLREVACADDAADALRAVHRLNNVRGADAPMTRRIFADPAFSKLAKDLGENTLLLVPANLSGDEPYRRYMYSYDVPVPWSKELRAIYGAAEGAAGLRRIRWGVGWSPTKVRFLTPGVADVASYHFELEPPDGLEILRGEMFVVAADGDVESVYEAPPLLSRAHLWVAGMKAATRGSAVFSMRPTRRGIMTAAIVSALFTALVLWAGALSPEVLVSVERQADAGAAVLLVIPALAFAYMAARPGEHMVVSRILLPVRGVFLLLGLLPYLAAATIVLSFSAEQLRTSWIVLAGTATLCFLALLTSYFRINVRAIKRLLKRLVRGRAFPLEGVTLMGTRKRLENRRIRRIQGILKEAGSYTGRIDGFLGEKSEEAKRVFTETYGLQVEEVLRKEQGMFRDVAFVIGSIEGLESQADSQNHQDLEKAEVALLASAGRLRRQRAEPAVVDAGDQVSISDLTPTA
jgi:hypothetical protein